MARNSPATAKRRAFAELLTFHVKNGTRPHATAGNPWSFAELARAVPSKRLDAARSDRSPAHWCRGTALPEDIEPILDALFGKAKQHEVARANLHAAFKEARAEKAGAKIQRVKLNPAGPQFVPRGPQVAIVDGTKVSDRVAAAEPVNRQLQRMSGDIAGKLAEAAYRLRNQAAWAELSPCATALQALLGMEPEALCGRIGDVFGLMLQLGQFLDTDARVQRDAASPDSPLPPDNHALLSNLVRIAAPWLRALPTGARLDDASGRFLTNPNLLQPARMFVARARAAEAISAADEAVLLPLAPIAEGGGMQGNKAGNRLVGAAHNLTRALTLSMAAKQSGAADDAESVELARRAAETLTDGAAEVAKLTEGWPPDARHALAELVREARRANWGAPPTISPAEPPVPDDVEARARAMILDGRRPPIAWRPFIRSLDFNHTDLARLEPLSDLTSLSTLILWETNIRDLSVLAGLTGLQTLALNETKVVDVAPLAGLTGLQTLDLRLTRVFDVAPLAGLTGLQRLDLGRTQVVDVAPLAGLRRLRTLLLSSTQIDKIVSLAGLTGLQALFLAYTPIADVRPLADLTRLQHLDLKGTHVKDVSPLAGLTALRWLRLRYTSVTDVSALAHLRTAGLEIDGPE